MHNVIKYNIYIKDRLTSELFEFRTENRIISTRKKVELNFSHWIGLWTLKSIQSIYNINIINFTMKLKLSKTIRSLYVL